MFNLLALLTSSTKDFVQIPKLIADQPRPMTKISPNPSTHEVKESTKEKKKESCVDILFYANMMRYHCTRDGKIQDFQHRELQDLDCPSKFFDRFVEMKKVQLPREEYLRYQQMCQVYGEDYFEKRSSTSPEGRSM